MGTKGFLSSLKGIGEDVLIESVKYFDEKEEEAYYSGINYGVDLGIRNGIRMLLDVNTKDNDVINELNLIWNIPAEEAREKIKREKASIGKEILSDYLRNQGYSDSEIKHYIIEKEVYYQVFLDNNELLAKYDDPKFLKKYFDNK